MKLSPALFYNDMSIREIALAIDAHNADIERNYHLNLISNYNANGFIHIGKKFKPIEPFAQKTADKKKKTKADKENALNFLKEKAGR